HRRRVGEPHSRRIRGARVRAEKLSQRRQDRQGTEFRFIFARKFSDHLFFSRSRISSSNTSCRGGGGGAVGFASSLRRTRLISLTIMKIAKATMMKSNSACRNTP